MNQENKNSHINWTIILLIIILAVVGYVLFSRFADYTYRSDRNLDDIYRAKFWAIMLIALFTAILVWKRNSSSAPLLAVFGVSLYFIVIYAIMFRGTMYGINGHWGDNGYRMSIVCKIINGYIFSDANTKGLPSMYPTLWFYIMAIYAKLIGIQAFQTVKYGYLFIFLVYPWLLYFAWRPLVSSRTAAIISVATIFIGHEFINYIYYEHMTAALFMPWWLYFFEDSGNRIKDGRNLRKFYIVGALFGGALFMTYYYWFFMALMALPITLVVRYLNEKSWRNIFFDLRHKLILMCGVALVSTPFWVPLIWSAIKNGVYSTQMVWFKIGYADLTGKWNDHPLDALLVVAGIFFAAYLWKRWGQAKLILLFCGAWILFMLDRLTNLGDRSIQTRKILEFAHVFSLAPLAIGTKDMWDKYGKKTNIRYGMVAIIIVLMMIYSNDHTEIYRSRTYEIGINQRIPEADLAAMRTVDCDDKVFLTNRYIESCYIPYFLFIPISSSSAHFAAHYQDRRKFLKAIEKIDEPDLLAFSLANNIFDKVDYFYLPLDKAGGNYQLIINQIRFNANPSFDTLRYAHSLIEKNDYFIKRHGWGIYEINPPARTDSIISKLKQAYPEVATYNSNN